MDVTGQRKVERELFLSLDQDRQVIGAGSTQHAEASSSLDYRRPAIYAEHLTAPFASGTVAHTDPQTVSTAAALTAAG